MNTWTRKSLYAALAGVGALGVTGAAQAVNVSGEGTGEVLIYPYYTTRADAAGNAYNSLMSVVNTTSTVKAVKVRYIEGRNSREVLDFNLFLSPFDVWTAAVVPSASTGAKVVTADKSCTLPAIPPGGQDFTNIKYSGANDDKGGLTLDRTKEGYIEIIEMATYSPLSTTAINVTHVNSVPPGCAKVTDAQALADALPPIGGLMGGLTLINVNAGTDYTTEPTVLAHFDDLTNLYFPSGFTTPDLGFAFPKVSVVFGGLTADGGSSTFRSNWTASLSPADPVSAVLMQAHVLNEFVLDTVTKSGTDWVVTFPTKRFYVSPGSGNAVRPFQSNFGASGACDDVGPSLFDREENQQSVNGFSPQGTTQLCWEANILTFNNSNVLASVNSQSLTTTFQNGWLDLDLTTNPVHSMTNANTELVIVPGIFGGPPTFANPTTVTYFGMPVIGFQVQSFLNGSLVVGGTTVLSNYGGNFTHKYRRIIQ